MSILRIHKLRLFKVKVIEQRQEIQEPEVFLCVYCGRNEDALHICHPTRISTLVCSGRPGNAFQVKGHALCQEGTRKYLISWGFVPQLLPTHCCLVMKCQPWAL